MVSIMWCLSYVIGRCIIKLIVTQLKGAMGTGSSCNIPIGAYIGYQFTQKMTHSLWNLAISSAILHLKNIYFFLKLYQPSLDIPLVHQHDFLLVSPILTLWNMESWVQNSLPRVYTVHHHRIVHLYHFLHLQLLKAARTKVSYINSGYYKYVPEVLIH